MSLTAMQAQTSTCAPLQLLMLQLCNLAVQNDTSGPIPGIQAQLQVSLGKLMEKVEMQDKKLLEQEATLTKFQGEFVSLRYTQKEKENTLTLKLKKLEDLLENKSGACDSMSRAKEEMINKTVEAGRQTVRRLQEEKKEIQRRLEIEQQSSVELQRWKSRYQEAIHFLKRRSGDFPSKLSDAARESNEAVVELLINIGIPVNVRNSHQESALHEAAERGLTDMVLILLKAGAFVDMAQNCGYTPLHLAARNGYVHTCEALLDAGALVDKKTGEVCEQSDRSDEYDSSNELSGLFGFTSNSFSSHTLVNRHDGQQSTALHLAAGAGHVEVVQLLLQRGADLTLKNFIEQTPLDMARAGGHTQAIVTLSAAACPCRR